MTDREIILARIAAIYDKPPYLAKQDGQMKMILKCCGLGEYYDKYEDYLEPFYYYKGYKNDKPSYRIFLGLDGIFGDLLSDNKPDSLLSLLTELGNHIPGNVFKYEDYYESVEPLKQLYRLMGLDFDVQQDEYEDYGVQVKPFVGRTERIVQSFGMEKWLKENYLEVYKAYEGALDAYTQGNLGSAIEGCRTTLTGLFSKFKGVPFKEAKWKLGLATVTGDFTGTIEADRGQMTTISNEIEQLVNSDIADFFGDNLDGKFKKTKAIYAIYSMLSDYGTHRQEGTPEEATNEDALMMLRFTTDILVWVYQKQAK